MQVVGRRMALLNLVWVVFLFSEPVAAAEPVLESAPVFVEDWASGSVDSNRWYALRKKWGRGNHGVVPENVRVGEDRVGDQVRPVLICTAHGDRYDGPVVGKGKRKTRVGGVLVTQEHFASGRFEVVMKIPRPLPRGAVPAIWTYGYASQKGDAARANEFQVDRPLYNPRLREHGTGVAFYLSEIDFPEWGKAGRFDRALYNTYMNKQHQYRTFDTPMAEDGDYHTYTTEWRTALRPIDGVTDAQVVAHRGYWWVQDKKIPFENYGGNPLKRISKNRYAVYSGTRVVHFVDGKKVGENTAAVPCMSAQLNIGVWLPDWAGPADWEQAQVFIASVRIWQFNDPGDVRGILTENITDNF